MACYPWRGWNAAWRILFWLAMLLAAGWGGAAAASVLQPVGHVGGKGYCVAVKDHYAYFDRWLTTEIYDIADPARPKLVGTMETGAIMDFQVVGDRGYLRPRALDSSGEKILIYDLSHPASPVLLATFSSFDYEGFTLPLAGMTSFFVRGRFFYGSFYYSCFVCDLADLRHPKCVGLYGDLSYTGGMIAQAGQTACFLHDAKVFETLNIASNTTPTLQGRLDLATYTSATSVIRLHTAGNLALVADDRKLHIIDISMPAKPALLSELALPYAAVRAGTADWDFATSGTRAYLYGKFPLNTIDFTNARAPRLLPEQAFKVEALNFYGSLCACREGGNLTLRNLASANPATPVGRIGVDLGACTDVVIGPITHLGYQQIAYLFATDGASLFSYPFSHSNPVQLGRLDGVTGKLYCGMIAGIPYLFCLGNDLKIVKANTPTSMSLVGQCTVPKGYITCKGALDGTRFYLRSGWSQLSVVDASNPNAPKISGVINFSTAGAIEDFTIRGNLAYLMIDTWGVEIYDISAPAKPVKLSRFESLESVVSREFALQGNYLYFYAWAGLMILDVSNPKNPVQMNQVVSGALRRQSEHMIIYPHYYKVRAAGNLAFHMTRFWNDIYLEAYDVSDRVRPVKLTSELWPVEELVYWQQYLYLAEGDGGLQVLKIGIKDPNNAAGPGWGLYR